MNAGKQPSIVVFGNAKGGVGKSTLALHFALQCMHEGLKVACLDADGDQGTLFRSIQNRKQYCRQHNLSLFIPEISRFCPNAYADTPSAIEALSEMIVAYQNFDIIVMDTQGSDTLIGRYIHQRACVLVSPVTESPLDLDLFVNISEIQEHDNHTLPLGSYAHMVWEQRLAKASKTQQRLEWILVRNRFGQNISKNQLYLEKILKSLAPRVGFHIAPSVGDRTIFRELFAYGLTVMDRDGLTTLAHITARQEIKSVTQYVLSIVKRNSS